MAPDRLNEFSSFVNQQMLFNENINEHLSKLSALIQVALYHDFSEFSQKTIDDYLWIISDIIENAYICSVHSLHAVSATYRTVNAAISSEK